MLENHCFSQQDSLTAALAVMHDSMGQLREGAAHTVSCCEELQVCSYLVQPHAQSSSKELFLSPFSYCGNTSPWIAICSCTMQRREVFLDSTASDINGAYFLLLQAHMNVCQVQAMQADQEMCMRAQQLAAEKVQLVQQQAKLACQEAELSECQTAFQERATAYSMTHSRLTSATLGDFSFAVSVCWF